MAPAAAPTQPSMASARGASTLVWRPTKIMNMRDLSKDDDFLSHLLVEKLGTGAVPLLVHKMDPSRRLPKTNADDLIQIVRRLVMTKGPVQHATRQAVDGLLSLASVRYYLKSYTQKQINAFATHASRYFELYHPSGSIEIAHTSRYSHRTGKSELCILATRQLNPGNVITELKGSMAHLTKEEDKELKRTDLRHTDIRRDFSVIHSRQMKKNHLFLGPARFVNHDCENNCELFREGKYITFRVIRPIAIGEEITAHYGDGYFGRRNRHCLCETCEKKGRGGYAPEHSDDEEHPGSDPDSGSDSDTSASTDSPSEEDESKKAPLNVNERRTRRGVYAIIQEEDDESDESDDEGGDIPLKDATDVPADIEMEAEGEPASELSSLTSSRSSSNPLSTSTRTTTITALGLPTPEDSDPSPSTSLSPLPSTEDRDALAHHQSNQPEKFKSIISTRRQKEAALAADAESESSKRGRQLATPPLSEDSASLAEASTPKRNTRSRSSLILSGRFDREPKDESAVSPSKDKSKGKTRAKEKPLDECESRVLRARPVLPPALLDTTPKPLSAPDIPRGLDGKPLPTCVTCLKVLPVISVDSKVVWGLGFEYSSPSKRGRKKKEKQECPRCMRHFAIYGYPWPSRSGSQAGPAPTPREETPVESATRRVTHKALPALDRKLAVAIKSRHLETPTEERPAKRRKTEPVMVLETSSRDQSVSRGRTTLSNSNPQQQDGEQPVKRKRGRPRLSSPRRVPVPLEKVVRPKSLAVQSQPRDSNGRFGKKGADGKRREFGDDTSSDPPSQDSERADEDDKTNLHLDGFSARHSLDEGSRASARIQQGGSGDDSDDESSWSRKKSRLPGFQQPLIPRPFASLPRVKPFRSFDLKPSPHYLARRSWMSRMSEIVLDCDHPIHDLTSDVPEKSLRQVPIGPERRQHKSIDLSQLELSEDIVPPPSRPALRTAAPVSFKPSPFNLARRRWSSINSIIGDNEASVRRSERLNGHSALSQAQGVAVEDLKDMSDTEDANYHSPAVGSISPAVRLKADSYHRQWSIMDIDISSSGEEDVILPQSPDPSMFMLQRRASFGHNAAADTTDSSEQAIDRLLTMSNSSTPQSCDDPALASPWKDSRAEPQYLRKSTPFSADVASPPNLVDAGWDISSDISVD